MAKTARLQPAFSGTGDAQFRPAWAEDVGADTDIDKDITLQWSVLSVLSKDADLRWALLQDATKDADLRWALLQDATKDADLRWALLQDATKDADLRWSLTQAIEKNADLRWALLQDATKDADFRFNLLQNATKDADFRFNLLQAIEKGAGLLFNLLQAIEKDADLRYSVLGLVLVNATLQWTLQQSLGTKARPSETITPGAWTPSVAEAALHTMINTAAPELATWIQTTSATSGRFRLSTVSLPALAGRGASYYAGGTNGGLRVRLYQGVTLVSERVHETLPTTPTLYTLALNESELLLVTDGADLFVELEATA